MTSTSLATPTLRVTLTSPTTYTLDLNDQKGWTPVATGRFGRLVLRTAAGERVEHTPSYTESPATPDSITLESTWTDPDSVAWTFLQRFILIPDTRQIRLVATATPAAASKVLHWSGPTLLAGDGTFGADKSDAIFPGLEYLLDAEPSSSTAFAAAKYADRTVPHPYKVTIPLMAVSHGGHAVGILWDPQQDYGGAWRHPSAVFSSPNRLENAENHLLGLFAPGVPRFVAENTLEAHRPLGVGPQTPVRLDATLVALADATSIDIVKVWVESYGLPPLEMPHSPRENVDLCVRSYLDVAWDETAEAWHHTLADPWGPRYEHRLMAQLWRYAQWPDGDPELRARARDQVRRGLARALRDGESASNPAAATPIPHLELALHYGHLATSLTAAGRQVAALLQSQDADGSWHWQPELMAANEYDTEDRRSAMGGGDSATGLTANRAQTLLEWARMTGDPACEEAGLRAVAWCNAQRRPEGAQTWELHLHVPDVLAVPYLIDVNLLAHGLTGDADYLTQADRWAWTGLPFTWLWSAYYRPIMAYGTVPCLGVTYHDVQSWFGVDVHWNGLVYADALYRLATLAESDLWQSLADGIVASAIQQQATSGPWVGMYPDAFSPVTGDEEYTWWLNPNLIGLNTFELAGIPLDLTPTTLTSAGSDAIRVTSGATVRAASVNGNGLSLLLDYPPDESSQTLIAGIDQPTIITADSHQLAEVADLDGATTGWTWLAEHGLLAVKTGHGADRAVDLRLTLG